MKQNLIMAAALACLCASCANDAVIEENRASDEIKFRVFTEGSTRADKVYCPSVAPEKFTVYATDGTNLIIDGDEIVKQVDGTYLNTTQRYWPESGTLTFDALLNGTKNSDGKVDFTVAAAAADQKDLIYAKATGSKATGQVTLNFRHALSQVVFNASNSNETLTVKVKSVSIHGINNKGVYTLPSGVTDGNIGETDHDGSEYKGTRGTWNVTGAEKTGYTITNTVTVTKTSGTQAISSKNGTDALMLIPGGTTTWNGTAAITTKSEDGGITYKEDQGTYFIVEAEITQKVKGSETAATIWNGPIAIAADFTGWVEGKRYVYTFAFGKGNSGVDPTDPTKPVFVPITFNVTVDEFVPATEDVNAGGTAE